MFDGLFDLPEISHRWMNNDIKRFRARFRCDDPFAIASSLSEATMTGSADEFKTFPTGTVHNDSIIEIEGAAIDPMLIEGDKAAIVHFDYNDNLSDVTLSEIAGNFASAFGYRTRKSLTSRQSKAIQIVNKDNLFYDRGTQINGFNYTNFNPNQGTVICWVKPYWDGDDGIQHYIFSTLSDSNNRIAFYKGSDNRVYGTAEFNNINRIESFPVTSTEMPAGTWQMLVIRWDINNTIDSSSNFMQIDLMGEGESGHTGALGVVQAQDDFLAMGQLYSTTPDGSDSIIDGLIYTEILERALTDAELTALYNSGAGVEPFVTPDTKLLSAGELSGGLPVLVQYPWVDNKFADGDQENDPAAKWSHTGAGGSGANTEVENEFGTVKYDLQCARCFWDGAASGEYVFLSTTVLVDNQDYYYRLWINTPDLDAAGELHLDIVGNSTVLTRRLDTGTDDMGVSYAIDTWLYFEGTFEADGAVAHEFRLRKVGTNDAFVYVDQMDVQVNIADNAAFEGTYVAGLAPGWVTMGVGSPTFSEETTSQHTGSSAQKVQGDINSSGIKQNTSVVLNKWYTVSFWLKIETGAGSVFVQVDNNIPNIIILGSDNGNVMTKYSYTIKVTDANKPLQFRQSGSTATTFIVDDVQIIELDTVTANAASSTTPEVDSYSEEQFGQGLRIDGRDTLSWAVKGNKNEGSIEIWLKPQFAADWDAETSVQTIYLFRSSGSHYCLLRYDFISDIWIFRKNSAVARDATSAVQAFEKGTRIHIIGTWGSNGVNIYVDSVIGTPNANTDALASNPSTFYLGGIVTVVSIPDSIIDELYVYSRELSAQEALKQFNANRKTVNDNRVFEMTKVLNANDKLRIDSENERVEFLDSSLGTFTNAIASMNAGSRLPKMSKDKSVIYNKAANGGMNIKYRKRWL